MTPWVQASIQVGGQLFDWESVTDLLASPPTARRFVVEVDNDGASHLRFGDDEYGLRPAGATIFSLRYRVGNGRGGNVAAEALAHVEQPAAAPNWPGVLQVFNPIPARDGTEPETVDEVRRFAPAAFRARQLRAVTAADYAAAAQRHPEVQRAAATRRWTGSWHTMFVTVDRKGGRPVDASFEQTLRAFLESFRMAGYDLEIDAPRYVSLDVGLTICVKPHTFKAVVKQALLESFSSRDNPDGSRGFFHPDNFTFGQPVYLSQIIARAMEVPGVASVMSVDRFQRYGEDPHGEIAAGFLPLYRLEIARLENDRNAQEHGRLAFAMQGGL
jgi:predicted phage baseplate assembly protein